MPKSLREEWQDEKKALEKAGVKMADISDKLGFGPALDDVVKCEAAYDKADGNNPKKVDAAKAALRSARENARLKAQKYTQVVHDVATHLDPHGAGYAKVKAALEATMHWLVQAHDDLDRQLQGK